MPQSLPFEHSISHRLFLLYGGQQFAFLICDKNGVLIHLKHFDIQNSKELSTILADCPELNEVYSKTELICTGNDFILIPEVLAMNNRIDLFLMSFEVNLAEQIIRHCGTASEAEICFAMDAHAYYLLKEKFPNQEIHQEAGILLDWMLNEVPTDDSAMLNIFISGKHLVVFGIDAQNMLVLCNSYPFSTMDEIQYWLTFIPDQLGFKGEFCSLGLIGSHAVWPDLKERMTPFFKNIKEMSLSANVENHKLGSETHQWLLTQMPLQLRSIA